MENTLDKKQVIKSIVKNSETCRMADVDFIQLKDDRDMVILPVLYTDDRASIEDLYTQRTYTRQGRPFNSVAAAEKLCDVYEYKHQYLNNPQFRVLGSFVGVMGAMKEFYQTYNIDTKLDCEYIRLTKQLKSYNYDSKETKSNIIKLANDLRAFFGGPVLVLEKVKTRDNDPKEAQMSM